MLMLPCLPTKRPNRGQAVASKDGDDDDVGHSDDPGHDDGDGDMVILCLCFVPFFNFN